ncbi:MAG: hypothetical protein JJ896_06495 [Rhodothermales bacterium]|nr:hypothetical protein [Rhodothermales bacterium]MBO6779284.1 hypothetical protein [Rhodothermales bacterium]
MPNRTFSEEEIQALLKRATQLHLMDEGDKPGLTLKDLEHIAADAGIPPQYLRAALHEADNQVSSRDTSGHTKTHVFIERVVEGELDDDEWEQVVYRMRKEYSNDMNEAWGAPALYGRGVTETLGKTREWRHTSSLGVVTTLTIRSAEGKQFINFQRRVGLGSPRAEGWGYGAILALLAGAIAGGVLGSVLALFMVFFAVLFIAAPGIEYLDRRWRDKVLREMGGVADDICRVMHDPVAAQDHEAAAEQVEPVVALDEAIQEDDAAIAAARSRARA